ncbi:unnamed protein product, partial [Pylaiella littoralis]
SHRPRRCHGKASVAAAEGRRWFNPTLAGLTHGKYSKLSKTRRSRLRHKSGVWLW